MNDKKSHFPQTPVLFICFYVTVNGARLPNSDVLLQYTVRTINTLYCAM